MYLLLIFLHFQKILKFGQGKFIETCFEGRTLNIHVVAKEDYYKQNNGGYDFKFALNPNCSRNPDEFICKCAPFTYIFIFKYCLIFCCLSLRLFIIMTLTNYIPTFLLRSVNFSDQRNIHNHVYNF